MSPLCWADHSASTAVATALGGEDDFVLLTANGRQIPRTAIWKQLKRTASDGRAAAVDAG